MKSQRIIVPSQSLDYTFVFAEENLTNYAQGTQGLTGANGAQGPQGDIGANGLDGTAGAQGPQGDIGITGTQGPQGDIGANGLDGTAGAQGPQGDTGATGATGLQGPDGDTGATGAQGDTGATGATGAQGSQGIQGALGSQGPQGSEGDGSKELILRMSSDNSTVTTSYTTLSDFSPVLQAGSYYYEIMSLTTYVPSSSRLRYRVTLSSPTNQFGYVVYNANIAASASATITTAKTSPPSAPTVPTSYVIQDRGYFTISTNQTFTFQISVNSTGGTVTYNKGSILRLVRTA